jgi:hypothetical protein
MTYSVEGGDASGACVVGFKIQDAATRVLDVSLKSSGASDYRVCPNAVLRYALEVVQSKIYVGELP